MSIDFKGTDIVHRMVVKFVHAFLPGAKKKYNAKVVYQPSLDIHGIASKAEVYNIDTSPKVIEEGLTAGLELIRYLSADGYKINTPLFDIHLRVPGEYDGTESRLPEGVDPRVSITADASFSQYIREHVEVVFDGVDETNGFIGSITDEATGAENSVTTIDNLLTIRGYGLKIDADEEHASEKGVFFEDTDGNLFAAKNIALNEPRTLKVIASTELTEGAEYTLVLRTQTSAKGHGGLLKNIREVRSEIKLTAQG